MIENYPYLLPKIEKLKIILEENNISECHGLNHAKDVVKNAILALPYCLECDDKDIKNILYAALLHDVDDYKFFPDNHNYENLRYILNDEPIEVINVVVTMVNLVSASKNGDTIPKNIPEFYLIPRYADRVEAIGIVGIARTFLYTLNKKMPLFIDTTPKPKNIDEIWHYANSEKYNNYKGKSDSMFDHFFDKLLFLGNYPISNNYLNDEASKRIEYMIDFILLFGNDNLRTDSTDNTIFDIKKYIQENNNDIFYKYKINEL